MNLLYDKIIRLRLNINQAVEKEFVANFGPLPRYAINRIDYTTLIDVEKAVKKIDRLFSRVDKVKTYKISFYILNYINKCNINNILLN